jgi:hypothetical protein
MTAESLADLVKRLRGEFDGRGLRNETLLNVTLIDLATLLDAAEASRSSSPMGLARDALKERDALRAENEKLKAWASKAQNALFDFTKGTFYHEIALELDQLLADSEAK